jgi:hypothetical protein
MIWDHSLPFPPDPNAPPSPAAGVRRARLAIEAPARSLPKADAFERELAQLRVIGPAAGAELRRIVFGDIEQAAPPHRGEPGRRQQAARNRR